MSSVEVKVQVCWNGAGVSRVMAIESIDVATTLLGMPACELPPAGTVVSIRGKAWRAGSMTAAHSVPLEPVFDVYPEAIR